jgi:hypothetical protein
MPKIDPRTFAAATFREPDRTDMVLALPKELLEEFLLYQAKEWPEGADLRIPAQVQLNRLVLKETLELTRKNIELTDKIHRAKVHWWILALTAIGVLLGLIALFR